MPNPSASVIEVRDWDRRPRRVPLRGPVVVGRECRGINVTDIEVSREHLRLTAGPTTLTAVDLGSSNGTMLNGRPLIGTMALTTGDRLRLGRSEIVVVAAPRSSQTRLSLKPVTQSLPRIPADRTQTKPAVTEQLVAVADRPAPVTAESVVPAGVVESAARPAPSPDAPRATSPGRLDGIRTAVAGWGLWRDKRRLAWPAAAAGLGIVAVIVLSAGLAHRAATDAADGSIVLHAAQVVSASLNTYSPDTGAMAPPAGAGLTDEFKRKLADPRSGVIAAATQPGEAQTVDRAESALQTLTDDKASVLIVLYLTRTRPSAPPSHPERVLTVDLDKVNGVWLAAGMNAV